MSEAVSISCYKGLLSPQVLNIDSFTVHSSLKVFLINRDKDVQVLQVMDDQLQDAQKQLGLALRLLPRGSSKNRTAILSYLVPVAMLQGRMPRSSMLKENGLAYFLPLVEALKAGNPVAVEDALLQEERRYMRVCTATTHLFSTFLHLLKCLCGPQTAFCDSMFRSSTTDYMCSISTGRDVCSDAEAAHVGI